MALPDAPILVWFRQDLRLADNPALAAAASSGRPLICLYLLDDEAPGPHRIGGAGRWWLHHSLTALGRDLAAMGVQLTLRAGRAETEIPRLVEETSAVSVFWNRCYEPFATARDTALKQMLQQRGCIVESFQANLLFEPWTIRTKTGAPFKVFTPFWRACRCLPPQRALAPRPKKLRGLDPAPARDDLDSWRLQPTSPDWAAGFHTAWTPGEAGAHAALNHFSDTVLRAYADSRDRADQAGVSRLSPHLHWGEISPPQIWSAVQSAADDNLACAAGAEKFFTELGWREFSYHLLFHWPDLPSRNWRGAFDAFPWRDDTSGFKAWSKGRTGYPMVDAGMRELWATGYMHNRVRMIAASFLIKHLLIDWRRGEEWFWDTLVDADLASNAASWQWVAGSGADASPYFRIFNPVTQGARFDPDGAYVRRWIPELAALANEHIHAPWLSPDAARLAYPAPIVDHTAARARALEAFAALRSES